MSLDDAVRTLAHGPNFAALTTLMADGQPQTNVMWIDADEHHLLINTETHRQKFANIGRDPRVTVALIPNENPYSYAEVRGRVIETITGDEARAHLDRLAHKYLGSAYPADVESERVILKIAPDRQRTWTSS